jgi:hypothetical protein
MFFICHGLKLLLSKYGTLILVSKWANPLTFKTESFGIWEAEWFARDSLKFEKRSQFFVGGDDESLSVVAVCISNEDRLSVGINRCDAAPTPTGFAEIVSDDFPELHVDRIVPLLVSTQQSQNDMKGGAMTRASVLNWTNAQCVPGEDCAESFGILEAESNGPDHFAVRQSKNDSGADPGKRAERFNAFLSRVA